MTSVPAKDRPKLIVLAVLCLLMTWFVISRVSGAMGGGAPPPPPAATVYTPTATTVAAAVVPVVERVDLPPVSATGPDPFRVVLPKPRSESLTVQVKPKPLRPQIGRAHV